MGKDFSKELPVDVLVMNGAIGVFSMIIELTVTITGE